MVNRKMSEALKYSTKVKNQHHDNTHDEQKLKKLYVFTGPGFLADKTKTFLVTGSELYFYSSNLWM